MKRVALILLFFAPLLHAQNPTGTGTANYTAKWSSSTNLTTSALCQSVSGGLVGVATCSPTQRLQVNSGDMVVKGLNNFTGNGHVARYFVGDTNHVVGAAHGAGLYFSTYKQPMDMVIRDSVSDPLFGAYSNIGLGTTTPHAFVDVQPGNLVCFTDGCTHGEQHY